MNHHDRLTKAYRGLNTDQLAALAFHYISDGNALESRRLCDAVPMKDYRCLDAAYEARLDSLMWFSARWAIEHWRWRCRSAETLAGALAAVHSDGYDEKAETALERHENAEKCLLALDAVLLDVCRDHGIDPGDVRKLAGAQPFAPAREGMAPDTEVVAMLRAGLTQEQGLVGQLGQNGT